jgi:hypothetical protein
VLFLVLDQQLWPRRGRVKEQLARDSRRELATLRGKAGTAKGRPVVAQGLGQFAGKSGTQLTQPELGLGTPKSLRGQPPIEDVLGASSCPDQAENTLGLVHAEHRVTANRLIQLRRGSI